MKIIDKLAWIEVQNGKILSTRSKGKSVYYIPGGKREEGESDEEALIREIKEELSVDILPGSMNLMGFFEAQADGHPPGVIVKMTCYVAGYQGKLSPASEIAEISWLDYQDRSKISAVDQIIFDFLKNKSIL